MTTVTNYKTQGTNLSNICNTVNQDYYGDVTTGYKQATIDIGTVLCSSTFSSVPGSIVPSGYSASINQYNTGAVSWTKSTVPSITYGFASSVSDMSSTGQYAVCGISNSSTAAATIYYSSNYGVSWAIATGVTGNFNFNAITMSGTGQNCCMIKDVSGPIYISSDYGATWSSSGSLSITWADISMSYTGQYAVACINGSTSTGKIYKSNNYGSTWTDVGLPAGYLGVWSSISMSGSGLFAIAFSNQTGQIYVSNDYGNSWSPIITISAQIFSMSMSYSGQYAVFGINNATNGNLYYSSNYGITWTLSASTISQDGNGLIVSMSNTGQYALVCAYGGTQLRSFLSKDYGQTYSQGTYSFPSSPNNISISGNGIYAITSSTNNGIYYTSNTSTTYTSMEITTVFEPLYKYYSWNPTNSILGYWVAISMSYTGQYVIALDDNSNRLYYSSDYGVTWNVSPSITNTHYSSIISISSSGQYGICSPNSASGLVGIWYTSNYGATWTKSATASTTYWQGSSISSGGKYAIASTVGTTRSYYSSNYGVTWTINAVSVPAWVLSAISGNGYAIATQAGGGGSGGNLWPMYYSTNNGQTWTLSNAQTLAWKSLTISSSGQYAIASDSKFNNVLGAYEGHIYISVNYGVDWTLTLTVANTNLTNLTTSYSGQYAIVIGLYDNGTIQLNISKYSNDFGNTWTDITNTILNYYNNSISISGSGQYAVLCNGNSSFSGTLGYIYSCIATNNIITPSLIYNTWTVAPSSATGAWTSLSMSNTGQYAIGCISSGQIYYSNTYGQSWTISSSATGTWTSVSISGNGQYAVGCISSGQIYYSNTYGQSWTVASSVTGGWTSVSMSGNGQYAIGCVNPGQIYYSNTYGQSWTIASSGLSSPWYSVSIAGNGQYAIACDNDGANGYIYYSINYGQSWTVSSSPNNLWISVSISGNGQYAVGCASPGIIFYSNTYGQSWNVTTSATYNWYSVAISGSGQYGIACVNGGQIYYCKATQ